MRRSLVAMVLLTLACTTSNDPPPPGSETGGMVNGGSAAGGAGGKKDSGVASGGASGQGGAPSSDGKPAPASDAAAGGAPGAGGGGAAGAGGASALGGAGATAGMMAGAGGGAGGAPVMDAASPADVPVDQAPPVDTRPPAMDVSPDQAAGVADFYQLSLIHRIEITMDPALWQGFMQEHARPEAVPMWRQADFKIDGVALTKVGFKTFGFGSRLFAPNKPNLNLDINKYTTGQSLNGLTRMRIKNNGQDPSGLRQALTYEAMRAAGVGAPRSTFAELFVNNEPYGFYSVEEPFTSSFVFSRTGNENGAAYEANDCHGFVAPAVGGCASILDNYQRSFNPLVGAGEDLVALCNVMNGPAPQFLAAITPLIDLDQWILDVAADTALAGDYDGFSTNGNNFRMYHDTATGKMHLYIYGPDVTFDPDFLPFPHPLKPEPGMDCTKQNATFRDIFLEKLLATPAGADLYKQAVKKLRGGAMSPATIKSRVDTLWTLVGAKTKADPRRVTTPPDPETSKEGIKTYIDARMTQLDSVGL